MELKQVKQRVLVAIMVYLEGQKAGVDTSQISLPAHSRSAGYESTLKHF